MTLASVTLSLALTAAPWLLLGLFVAGLIKGLISEAALQRWVGGRGLGAIARAAVIGAPLPLCSCGAIPTALALYRKGAGRGPATAFLVGTPGIGVDSLAISHALLGPVMAVARALGAVVTAILAGLLVATTGGQPASRPAVSTACSSGCGTAGCCTSPPPEPVLLRERIANGLGYAFSDVLDDISRWILVGLLLAGALMTFVPPETLASHGSGLAAMLLMALVGIPLYICAAAATPIGAAMLLAGVSPGTVLVFLIAGPITSFATLGVLQREMGTAALVCYLGSVIVASIGAGLALDALVSAGGVDIIARVAPAGELLPAWLEWTALLVLLVAAVRPLRTRVLDTLPSSGSASR